MRIKRSLSAIIATIFIAAVPLAASAQVSVGIGIGFNIGAPPPPLPYYTQPPAPFVNAIWTPGYWAWGPAGYYWVPGTWVQPPSVGLYWTPGYWGYTNGAYGWTPGYWGPSVGFYGGINYGFGYFGTGFVGGFWNAGMFNYNTAVMNVNRTVIHNTFNKTVINRNVCNHCTRVAFNGGHGGINARPTSAQLEARRDGIAATREQRLHANEAAQDRSLAARVNHGRPPTTAVDRPISNSRSLPHFEAVRSTDRQAAQADVRHGSVNASLHQHSNAGTMQSAPQHNAAQSHPHNNQPPSGTLHSNERSKTTTTHGNVPPQMHTNTQMHQNAHPSGNSMHGNAGMYGAHQGGGKPPSGSMQAHPQGNKPPSGNDKNKPPRR
jgi:hypothetical protein